MPLSKLIVDPEGCGCTDCILKYSYPLDAVPDHAISAALQGATVLNRSSCLYLKFECNEQGKLSITGTDVRNSIPIVRWVGA